MSRSEVIVKKHGGPDGAYVSILAYVSIFANMRQILVTPEEAERIRQGLERELKEVKHE